jgi:hypothetical protein
MCISAVENSARSKKIFVTNLALSPSLPAASVMSPDDSANVALVLLGTAMSFYQSFVSDITLSPTKLMLTWRNLG